MVVDVVAEEDPVGVFGPDEGRLASSMFSPETYAWVSVCAGGVMSVDGSGSNCGCWPGGIGWRTLGKADGGGSSGVSVSAWKRTSKEESSSMGEEDEEG